MRRYVLAAILVLGCGDDGGGMGQGPPSAPSTGNDPAYQVTAKAWLMAGDGLTAKDDTYDVAVTAPAGTSAIDLWIDQGPPARLTTNPDGSFHASVPAPAVGEHQVLLAVAGQAVAFAALPLHVSHALYTVVSTDWDDSDNPDANYNNIAVLRQMHPQMVMTQFVGPYVLTDAAVAMERRQFNIDYIKMQRDMYGDEIGVHIHPWCSYVSTTSVPCRTMPSTTMPAGDSTGYTVEFVAYTPAEQATLLSDAADLFMQNGLGRPTSFRSGGWIADLTTIGALETAGYTIDSSAFPPQTIQAAWPNTVLASWTLEHWGKISQTAQPYYPSMMDIQSPMPAPAFPVLEVPDNGTLVDYMGAQDMINVLHMNFPDGKALAAPTVFQVGFHPPSFISLYFDSLNGALTEVDKHLYKDDAGPIRYAVLRDLLKVTVWSHP